MVYVDLHIHTNASDGAFSLVEIAQQAVEKDIKIIAVTDHETVDGLVEMYINKLSFDYSVKIIPGVELSTEYKKRKLDILGYNIDHKDKSLIDILGNIKVRRAENIAGTIEKLKKAGITINFEDLRNNKRYVGYQFLMEAIVNKYYPKPRDNKDYSKMLQKARCDYGLNSSFAVHNELYDVSQLVDIILNFGGIPVLAHQFAFKNDKKKAFENNCREIEELVRSLRNHLGPEKPLGIEVFYPKHNKTRREFLASLAQDYELLVTGGSDFHGNPESKLELGKIVDGHKLKAKEIKDFLKATGRYYK